ncbi:MAG: hypothetical protein FWH20_10255 [Oscillospiraceae bacterium]|nr:hypothetical protein [Oscillospiraceae bacterium]
METIVKMGTKRDRITAALCATAGAILIVPIAFFATEDYRQIVLPLVIAAVALTVLLMAVMLLMHSTFCYRLVLTGNALIVRLTIFSRHFHAQEIPYENITSIEPIKHGRMRLAFLHKGKYKSRIEFSAERQDEFCDQLRDYVHRHCKDNRPL